MLLKDFNYKNDFRDISSEISLLPESRKSSVLENNYSIHF